MNKILEVLEMKNGNKSKIIFVIRFFLFQGKIYLEVASMVRCTEMWSTLFEYLIFNMTFSR